MITIRFCPLVKMATCLPGLQGFPIQVNGWQSTTDKSNFLIPNDISLQFNPGNMPMLFNNNTYTINGSNTFFMGGTQYFVNIVRICQTKQEGLSTKSTRPLGELHIWGLPTATTTLQNSIALLNIPIFQGLVNTDAGNELSKLLNNMPLNLQKLIPRGDDTEIVRYSTCVETDKNSIINIVIGYWSAGITLKQEDVNKLTPILKPFGVPRMRAYKLLSSYVDTESGKGRRIYNENNGILEVYPSSVSLSASSSDFLKGFRYIKGFVERLKSETIDTSALKCININRQRDIKNGKLLIDPSTGKRLSEVNEESEAEGPQIEESKISPRAIMETIFIILGIIIGISLIIMLGYGIYYLILTRKSLGIPPVDPKTSLITQKIGPLASD